MKLVVLSPGMTGLTHELKADKTTVGRSEDNAFQLTHPSVSGHHCEILLRGSEVAVRDLNSTNGTYINGDEVTEHAIKPGQVLRLGEIELRLETEASAGPAKKHLDRTTVIPGGVSWTDLDQAHDPGKVAGKGTGFSKKTNTINETFIIVALVLGAVVIALLVYVFTTIRW
jgi:pSer/pThr/pTyr-binding forkhead associated (FHA) protein